MNDTLPPLQPWIPGKSPSEQMLWLAVSYARAAKLLCEAMTEDELTPNYTNALVVLHLCRHATELFLKGAAGVKTGSPKSSTHHLDSLYEEYQRLYPHEDQQFSVPFSAQIFSARNDLFPETVKDYRKGHDQQYRYPTTNDGKKFEHLENFDPSAAAQAVDEFFQALNFLVLRIQYPGA